MTVPSTPEPPTWSRWHPALRRGLVRGIDSARPPLLVFSRWLEKY